MMLFIENNIFWIKDFFTIVFSGTAIIIAILTYRRAKETILQPVRTEVIKRQSDLLIELLEFINKNSVANSLDGVDYLELVRLNSFEWAELFGFRFNKTENLDKHLENISAGQARILTSQLVDAEIIQPFSKKKMPNDKTMRKMAKDMWYKRGKSGNYEIDRMFLTKQFSIFTDQLFTYCNNPLIPIVVKNSLKCVLDEIDKNIKTHLKETVETLVAELFARDKKSSFSPEGVYNSFNHKRIHHNQSSDQLKMSIRQYLKIDNMP